MKIPSSMTEEDVIEEMMKVIQSLELKVQNMEIEKSQEKSA